MHERLAILNQRQLWLPVIGLWLILSGVAAFAASPQFNGANPWGVQRGKETEVVISGERLADAQQLLFYTPGISVTKLEATSPTALKATLSVAADCQLGLHPLRIRTASGLSNLRTLSVGTLPEAKEVEPNSDFAAPQKIALDSTISGVVENEDVDYFVVEAKKGERITAEIEGLRLGVTFFDPFVAIMDTRRFELARSDDSPLVRQDAVCSVVAPQDGSYIVQVRESSYAGNGGCMYRLHVGRFPRPMAVIPSGGKPGETLEVRWLGDVLGERAEKVTLPAVAASGFGLFARDERGIAPSANPFRLNGLGNVLEVEPNDQPAQATACEAPIGMCGVISKAGDVDHFKFSAKKGQVFDVRVVARALGSPLDSVVNINRIGGAGVAGNDDNGSPDSYVRFNAPEDDVYVVAVRDHLGQGGVDYAYRVEVAPVQPALTLGLPERSQYIDVTIPVPQNNRLAFLVSAQRADFGGELQLEFKDLPAGMTAEIVPMAANRNETIVLLTAPAGTALSGSLVDVVGRCATPPVEGHLLQRTSLVRGQNNVDVWSVPTQRMATAVTQEAPFRIEIVEPKVPLVRDGAMDLKVVATRKEGFNAPIPIRMLYNPPGVGSSGSIVIPEGKTEATIPLTANGGAEVQKCKIAVLGEATVGDGPVLVSSQLTNLEIAEQFLAFAFQAAAVEQGQQTDVVIKIEKKKDFEGAAKIELLGLPNEVTTEAREINKDTKELVFPVKTTAKSPAGRHKTVICRAIITANGEPINHTLGTGELRIDTPLPPKPAAAAAPAAAPAPMPVAQAAPPAEKRLSRLEKLRQDSQKNEPAAK